MKHALLLGSIALAILPVKADVRLVNAHGFMLENTRMTEARPEAVYRALVQDVDKWWPKDHSWWRGSFSIDPVAGGCFCEKKGSSQAQHMIIVRAAPPSLLVMEGGLGPLQQMGVSGALSWSVNRPQGEQRTTVTLTYNVHGISESGFAQLASIVDVVQASQLSALTDYVNKQD